MKILTTFRCLMCLALLVAHRSFGDPVLDEKQRALSKEITKAVEWEETALRWTQNSHKTERTFGDRLEFLQVAVDATREFARKYPWGDPILQDRKIERAEMLWDVLSSYLEKTDRAFAEESAEVSDARKQRYAVVRESAARWLAKLTDVRDSLRQK